MACNSYTAILKDDCADGVLGGIEKFYIIAFKDLAPATGSTNNNVYTTSTGGLVSEIGLQTGKKFVEIATLPKTSGFDEDFKKDNSAGYRFFEQSVTLVLSNLTSANRQFVMDASAQSSAVIVKTITGKYFALGLNGLLELTGGKTGSGLKETDLMGYSLTFSGIDTQMAREVDPTIIPGLIA